MEQIESRKRQDIINLSASPTAIDSVKCKQMNGAAILGAEVKYLIKDLSGGDEYVVFFVAFPNPYSCLSRKQLLNDL
jgi:hypothetical protein